MASLYEYLLEQQEFVKRDMAALLENQSDSNFKQRFADRLAKLMAIQHMIEHKDYGDRSYKDETYADSAIQSNILTVINDRKKLLSDRSQFALRLSKKDLVHIACGENGTAEDLKENDIKTEDIKARFLQQTGRNGILTEDEQRPDHYWLGQMETQIREGREKAFTQGEISEEDAKYHLATAIALTQISYDRKESLEQLQSKLEERRKEIMNGTAFQRATEGKSGAEIAAICGKLDPENKTFGSYGKDELNQAYQNAVVTRSMDIVLGRMHDSLKKGKFNLKNARYRLAAALMYNDVLNGKIKVEKVPINLDDWKDTEKERDKLVNDPSFNWIEKMSREDFVAMCGKYNNETKEYTPYSKDVIFANFNAERDKYFEQQRQKEEAEKKAAEEAKLKEEQPKVEAKEKPFDSAEHIANEQRYWTGKLEELLTGPAKDYSYQKFMQRLCYINALNEMQKEGFTAENKEKIESEMERRRSSMEHNPDNVSLGMWKSKEDIAAMLGTTENGEYHLKSPDQVMQAFHDGIRQVKREKRMRGLCEQALNSVGEERSRAIANILALSAVGNDSNKAALEKGNKTEDQLIQQFVESRLKNGFFLKTAADKSLNKFLEKGDFNGLVKEMGQRQIDHTKETREEKQLANEAARRERAEAEQKNLLSDKDVAKLDMTKTGDALYSELGKLGNPLSDAYGEAWQDNVLNAQLFFVGYKGAEGFKDAIGKTEQFLKTKLSDGKTIGQFARENHLLGANYDKLMYRARNIAGIEQPKQQSAAKWIEDFKKQFHDNPEQFKSQPGYPMVQIARIMAARELSNSTRGKAATLNVQMTEAQIKAHADKLMEDSSFEMFTAELAQDQNKLSKVEAVFTKRFSHGGELDDFFRGYLTNRPAGELQNSRDLKRWMPTVKQRVEKLQKDAAKAIKEKKVPYAEAAEIVALRQMAEVQRGGRGLEANIPVVGEKDGNVKDLSKASKAFAESKDFKDAFNKEDVKKYILSGHGGAMVENYKKQPEADKVKEQGGQQL